MRVLRVLGSLDPATGGPPSVFSAAVIATAAADASIECLTLRTRGRDIAGFPDHRRLVARGIAVHAKGGLFGAALFLLRHVRRFDVIHVDGCWVPISILAVALARLSGRRSAVTPHETLTYEERRRTRSRLRKQIKRLIVWFYVKLCDCVIYSSALEARDSPAHRMAVVIPHPVYDDLESAPPRGVRDGFAAAGQIRFGYLGRFHPKKHLEYIISAAVRAKRSQLLLAGSGDRDYESELRALDDGSGRISWVGFVTGQRREQFFREVDFVVLASEYECFGMAAAEALVRGIPAIVTKRVGVADDVAETGSGIVIANGADALLDAFEMCCSLAPERYAELQRNALRAAARYGYSSHGFAQASLYRRLLELPEPDAASLSRSRNAAARQIRSR
ncbi:glycosyltransferase involved in cell wall biosynthesis [Rhodopseudomonas thermotolerans]|uniref:Glycosyltransferase involved in cell wall biosynthesis n=2 Tax=Rhodopseudomonas TaxID=1073 RepID=A0A336JS22_9BRAD|nr:MULTISPECIES: glycosyltransferase [Rhodopseudomonas]RED35189.1 glycosyltransferase involved in cell wall biosynthesis [Rhodopseudomonas pentothenatexigens]REG03032.1 glycosyltransferase involved in cell wall biosynthesis [Rhodopseudomonas thermotolerans]SSW90879.1 glycosyltransferase involved in cell wall bisynthesis [Rhodopseudomonas pentothenatexigens]